MKPFDVTMPQLIWRFLTDHCLRKLLVSKLEQYIIDAYSGVQLLQTHKKNVSEQSQFKFPKIYNAYIFEYSEYCIQDSL